MCFCEEKKLIILSPMSWIDQTYTYKWPILWQLVQKQYLFLVEFAYATLVTSKATEAEAAVYCLLLIAARKGHLCIKIEQEKISPSIEELIPESNFHPLLEKLLREGAKEKKRLYLPKYFSMETSIVEHVTRLLNRRFLNSEKPFLESNELTQEQNTAIENAFRFPLSLILGGPGTGKTFTAKHIVKCFLKKGMDSILLTAPTGKAAAHLAEKISNASPSIRHGTLHAMLRLHPFEEKTQTKTLLDAELVIVDECSMIDARIFSHLLAAIDSRTHVVLMGDIYQLPSIEEGAIFQDLAKSPIPKITLTKTHRSSRKEILDLAQSILEGKATNICNIDLGFKEKNIEKILQNLWKKAEEYFPLTLDPDIWFEKLEKFRILSTLRKGLLGVDALNAFFYEQFVKKTNLFPIIITQNDTKKTGLCNGDVGILIQGKRAIFPEGKVFECAELPSFEYAYCLSVHKSQGSEYDRVILLVPEGSEVFGREILYTAVTRAKTHIEIDGDPREIQQAIHKHTQRISGISERLQELGLT